MSKHPHRLMLNQKKTWRCTIPGCRYFIHLGLAHTLPGQRSICWGCSEEFTLDDAALEDDRPMCSDCRNKEAGMPSQEDIENYTNIRLLLAKRGVKSLNEFTESQINMMVALGTLPKNYKYYMKLMDTFEPKSQDEIEVIEPDEDK